MILGYFFMVLPFVVMIGLGFLIPVMIIVLYRHFEAGVVSIFGMHLIEALCRQVRGLNLRISLYNTNIVLALAALVNELAATVETTPKGIASLTARLTSVCFVLEQEAAA